MNMDKKYEDIADLSICFDCLFHLTKTSDWELLINHVCNAARKVIILTTNTYVITDEFCSHINYQRKILPLLDKMENVLIEEIVTKDTVKENSIIILSKI